MSKRNSRAAKAARRRAREDHEVMRAILEAGPGGAPEIGIQGGRAGCPEVPTVPVPVEVMMQRPGAVRVPDEDLAEGMAAAVRWPCSVCGQVHISMWGSDLSTPFGISCFHFCVLLLSASRKRGKSVFLPWMAAVIRGKRANWKRRASATLRLRESDISEKQARLVPRKEKPAILGRRLFRSKKDGRLIASLPKPDRTCDVSEPEGCGNPPFRMHANQCDGLASSQVRGSSVCAWASARRACCSPTGGSPGGSARRSCRPWPWARCGRRSRDRPW